MGEARIVELGRGPTIAGTRITVYSILEYLDAGWAPERLVEPFPVLTQEQISVACAYVREHESELRPELHAMLTRDQRGNPPELQAKIDANRDRFRTLVREKYGIRLVDGHAAEANGVHPA